MSDADDTAARDAEVERLRRENEELQQAVKSAEAGHPPRHRGRHIAAVALLVLGSILAPIAVLGVWTRNQITDTDRYVRTVTPLASDPQIQALVAERVTNTLFEKVDVQARIAEALPTNQAFLAGTLTSALRTAVEQITLRLVESDQFKELWVNANRLAHQQLVNVMTGEGPGSISTKQGTVTIDLSNVVQKVQSTLQDRGIDLFSSFTPSEGAAQITTFKSEQLRRAQSAFNLFDTVATWLPWLALACLVAAALLFQDRRRGIMWAGAGVAISMVVLLLGLTLARTVYLNAIPADIPTDTARSFFDIIIRFLRQGARLILAIGLLVYLGAVVMGPSKGAVRLRAVVKGALGRAGDEAGAKGWDLGPVGAFVAHNLKVLRVAVGVLGAVVLVAWDQPTATVVLVVTLLALLALGVLEVVARSSSTGARLEPQGQA